MRRIEISFLERSEEVKELENTKNKLAKELEVTRKGYLQKNKKRGKIRSRNCNQKLSKN